MAFSKEQMDLAKEPHAGGQLSDLILGAQDGLVNVLGVILGVAVASQEFRLILVAGLAATFAESISMGAVAYTSTKARRDHYARELERERREIVELPEVEREEVRQVCREWGLEGEALETVVEKITSNEKAWLSVMMAHELKLAPVSEEQPRRSALIVGFAAIGGSLVPLIPFLFKPLLGFTILWGVISSLVLSAGVLFLIGVYKAKVTIGKPGKSGAEMVVIGILAALAGFGIGLLFGPGVQP